MSIRTRIVLGYVFLLTSSLAFITYLIIEEVRPRYLEAVEEGTVDLAQLLSISIAEDSQNNALSLNKLEHTVQVILERTYQAKIYQHTKYRTDIRVYVTDTQGILLYDSENLDPIGSDYSQWNDVFLTLRGEYGARSSAKNSQNGEQSTVYVAAPIIKNGSLLGVVSVGKPKDSVSVFINIAKQKLLIACIFVTLSAIGLALILSYWIARPIQQLITYTEDVAEGNASTPPKLGRSDVAALGASIEHMRQQLEGKEYVEEYIQTLTHELKSPLTAIRGAAELLQEELPKEKQIQFLQNITDDANRLHGFADKLLELSGLERLNAIEKNDTIDFTSVLTELTESFTPLTTQKDIQFSIHSKHQSTFKGNAFLITRALANLIQNAIAFAPEHSVITLNSHDTPEGVKIMVKDYGTGIPEYAKDKVFDKFYSLARPNGEKKSTGLGLPFVKEVAILHQGSIALHNNHGLEATLYLKHSCN